jgi:hypothetical protein
MNQTPKPVHSFRYGSVSCAIWANNSTSGYFFNTTFIRTYRVDDSWGESISFEDRDLPALMKAAADAHSWIQRRKSEAVTSTVECAESVQS